VCVASSIVSVHSVRLVAHVVDWWQKVLVIEGNMSLEDEDETLHSVRWHWKEYVEV
jgi:hypothetical protein